MAISLRVPPSRANVGDTWEREDGILFTWVDSHRGWVR